MKFEEECQQTFLMKSSAPSVFDTKLKNEVNQRSLLFN